MSYSFWNNFVDTWCALSPLERTILNPILINGWTNPNSIPLLNSDIHLDFSLKYIPEPWWGNNGSDILHSVVINYNPGEANNSQHYLTIGGLNGFTNYQDLISHIINTGTFLVHTNNWHFRHRALPIFNSLSRVLGIPLAPNNTLKNNLSIELIPWHTKNISSLSPYIYTNLKNIYDNCIVFAATESMRIANKKLKNNVVLRINGTKTIDLLNDLTVMGICSYTVLSPISHTPSGNGSYFQFSIDKIKNITFTSIWGKNSRNSFPPNIDLDFILNIL
jgi:hypothetical protein